MRQKTSDNWPWYNNPELDFDCVPYETLAKQLNLPKNPTNKPKQDVCETSIYIRNEIADHFRYNHLVDSDTLTHTRDLFWIFKRKNRTHQNQNRQLSAKLQTLRSIFRRLLLVRINRSKQSVSLHRNSLIRQTITLIDLTTRNHLSHLH